LLWIWESINAGVGCELAAFWEHCLMKDQGE
jgi:hypothetical protein